MNNEGTAKNYLDDAIRSFRSYKRLAERALEQVSNAEFLAQIDDESNSRSRTYASRASSGMSEPIPSEPSNTVFGRVVGLA